MINLHGKSPCCQEKVVRFGNKRRQCTHCGSTWSVHPRKQGKKKRRTSQTLISRVFSEKRTLASLARISRVSPSGMARRFQRSLDQDAMRGGSSLSFRARQYVLLLDGLWFRFGNEWWTLYLRAVKPVTQNTAIFLNPIMLPGKENAYDWRNAIGLIPESLKTRIKAFVSDGFRGSKRMVKERGWIFQRCHFHLIAQLQIRRGRRKRTLAGRQTREEIYQTVRKILVIKNQSRVKTLKEHLCGLIRRSDCPKKLKSIVREFLRDIACFRAYLNHPHLNLPNTTNTIESMNHVIRSSCGKLRTPKSLALWAGALVKHHPPFTCKGAKYQQN